MAVPIIDLFAGPGGLGEGFSAFGAPDRRFRISLSVEMEEKAHQTLQLRAFFRQFLQRRVPSDYYRLLRGEIDITELYVLHPHEAERASHEAMCAELGKTEAGLVDLRIKEALDERTNWVLIGGPPCQAYSLAGRSRNKGNAEYTAEGDKRHFLYREYLRIIAEHRPPVFVMENVKGILSSQVNGGGIFGQIISDLQEPCRSIQQTSRKPVAYHIYSLVYGGPYGLSADMGFNPTDFIVKSELYGIPQARHRVILMGLRDDIAQYHRPADVLKPAGEEVRVKDVIADLPRVRSGLSTGDSAEAWAQCVRSMGTVSWLRDIERDVRKKVTDTIENLAVPRMGRGGEFVEGRTQSAELAAWFADGNIGGTCNHSTRGHIASDIHRYMFAACFAAVNKTSPVLSDFPEELWPDHKNVEEALKGALFEDRFRVQLKNKPATTVVSHISKDGHYYIHYDPTQCRSLTVREASRLQTFPDNYFFCGPRTSQYHQVGNAVPPRLAYQIAEVVYGVLDRAGLTDD